MSRYKVVPIWLTILGKFVSPVELLKWYTPNHKIPKLASIHLSYITLMESALSSISLHLNHTDTSVPPVNVSLPPWHQMTIYDKSPVTATGQTSLHPGHWKHFCQRKRTSWIRKGKKLGSLMNRTTLIN